MAIAGVAGGGCVGGCASHIPSLCSEKESWVEYFSNLWGDDDVVNPDHADMVDKREMYVQVVEAVTMVDHLLVRRLTREAFSSIMYEHVLLEMQRSVATLQSLQALYSSNLALMPILSGFEEALFAVVLILMDSIRDALQGHNFVATNLPIEQSHLSVEVDALSNGFRSLLWECKSARNQVRVNNAAIGLRGLPRKL
ncbi:hypothetical protein AALP_AA7G204400 [Arabis alpina]|uniref:Uncharacterized protein n=1 Tax=Arabis alpina TaxID=50452 RepID=A0A087GJE6_ARAAL|nr:hypothetical protein AALP_AA7G204400 [Arabis alpina]